MAANPADALLSPVAALATRGRGFNGGLATPGVQLPAMLALVICREPAREPEPRVINALPLLVPLALLAALEIDSLKRGFSAALDWFGILTFGLLAARRVGLWIDARAARHVAAVAALFRDTEIGYRPTFHSAPCLRRRAPDGAVAGARASGASLEPARACSTGPRA